MPAHERTEADIAFLRRVEEAKESDRKEQTKESASDVLLGMAKLQSQRVARARRPEPPKPVAPKPAPAPAVVPHNVKIKRREFFQKFIEGLAQRGQLEEWLAAADEDAFADNRGDRNRSFLAKFMLLSPCALC